MCNSNINFTNRMLSILRDAENEAHFQKLEVLQPIHLLIACLNEKTGVLGEISLKIDLDKTTLKAKMKDTSYQHSTKSVFSTSGLQKK